MRELFEKVTLQFDVGLPYGPVEELCTLVFLLGVRGLDGSRPTGPQIVEAIDQLFFDFEPNFLSMRECDGMKSLRGFEATLKLMLAKTQKEILKEQADYHSDHRPGS